MTTIRELITGSMRLINVVAANETPSEGDMEIAKEAFTGLIDGLQADLLNIYTINPYRFLLVGGQQEYTLGPGAINNELSGADWVLPRPMRVERAVLLQGANVAYPIEPTPPAGCCFLSSQDDDNVTDLWHFDEPSDSLVITATKSFPSEPITAELGGNFSLVEGSCENGLDLSNVEDFSLSLMLGDVELGNITTYEFQLINTGAVIPSLPRGAVILRLTWMYYGGEGAADIYFYLMPDNWVQIRTRFNPDTALTGFALPEGEVVNFALQFNIDTDRFTIWANGTMVFDQPISDWYYTPWETDGSLSIESGSGVVIDELRRSNVARYSGTTYNYLSTEGACPAPEPKPNDYTWYGVATARNGYDGDVGLAGYIPTVPLVQIPLEGLQTIGTATYCRCVVVDNNGPRMGGGDRGFAADDGTARPMPVGATYELNHYDYGFLSTPFYFPAKEGDSLWITAASFPGTGQAFSFTVEVGPYGSTREVYVCTGSSQPYEPITFTITRTA